jgi:hypothetical protein
MTGPRPKRHYLKGQARLDAGTVWRARYEAGATLDQLAAETGWSPDGVRKILATAGTTFRPGGRRPKNQEHPMNSTTDYRKLTQAELLAEARDRFGTDPMKWAFICPSCGDIANGTDFREALTANPRKHRSGNEVIASDVVGKECIGRSLGALETSDENWKGRGCTWVAYGLICGPWEVALPDGRSMHAFPLAPAA